MSLNIWKLVFQKKKNSFEGKGKEQVGFENGPRRVAMQNRVMHMGPGCN